MPSSSFIPPWLNVSPSEAPTFYLQGVQQGERAGAAQRSAEQDAAYASMRNEMLRQTAIVRQATAAAQIARATADSLVKKASLERASRLAADRYEGMQGMQNDIANGMDQLDAVAKWSHKLFADSPASQASIINRVQIRKDTQARIQAQARQTEAKAKAAQEKEAKSTTDKFTQRDDAEIGKQIELKQKTLSDPVYSRSLTAEQKKQLQDDIAQLRRERTTLRTRPSSDKEYNYSPDSGLQLMK